MSTSVCRSSQLTRSSLVINTTLPLLSGPATHCGAQQRFSQEIGGPSMKRAGTADSAELHASSNVSPVVGLECPAGIKVKPLIRPTLGSHGSAGLGAATAVSSSGLHVNFGAAGTAPQLNRTANPFAALSMSRTTQMTQGTGTQMIFEGVHEERHSARSSSVPPSFAAAAVTRPSSGTSLFASINSTSSIKPQISPLKPLLAMGFSGLSLHRTTLGSVAAQQNQEQDGWQTVEKKKKSPKVPVTRSAPPGPLRTRFSLSRAAPMFYCEEDPLDAQEFYAFKGQASTYDKRGKMGHNYREVERITNQSNKRALQSAKQRGIIARDDARTGK